MTTLAPFGFLAPVGFAYAAHRARKPSWYAWGIAWGLLAFGGLAINLPAVEDSNMDGFSSLMMVTAWVGAFLHALAIREDYTRRIQAAHADPVTLARERLLERSRAQKLARDQPELARELGVGRPDLPGADSMGVVDINHAPREAIMELPGIDAALAERIVGVRRQIRGFSSTEDLGLVLDLDPDRVEGLRDFTVYLPH